MKKSLLFMSAVAVALPLFYSCDDDNDNDDVKDVPKEYTEAFQSKFPGVKVSEWERKIGYMVADFRRDGHEMEAWFGNGASWAMTVTDYDRNVSALPLAVTESFASSDYSMWTVDDVDFYERVADSFYVIEVEKRGERDTDLYYAVDGRLIKTSTDTDMEILPTTVL